jgi:Kef-type K+ transport system membrane component KefB
MIEGAFAQIALILLVAALVGFFAKLAKQPLIVAYIFVGIVMGPAALNVVSSTEEIELLAKLGIAILLFLVGLKLDVGLIKSTGVVALLTGVGQVVFTSVIGFFIVIALGFDYIPALYIAVALTFSSTIIIVKLLSDKRELDQLHGRIAVGFLIVQDILVVVAMVIIVSIGEAEGTQPSQNLWVTLFGSIAFLAVVALLAKYVVPRLLEWLARSQELSLIFGVGWAMSLAGVSEILGLSMEIGAFVAGVALATTPYRESLGNRMISLRDVLILFFFIELGSSLTFADAVDQLWPAILLSLFVLIGNPIIVMVIMGFMGYRSRVSFKAGLAVAQISEFSLILVALGFSLGQVDQSVLSLVTLVGIITITLSTYFILYSDQMYNRLAPALRIFEKPDAIQSVDEDTMSHPYDAIIVGAGRLGSGVIKGLRKKGSRLLVVDMDPQALKAVKADDIDTLYGDVGEPDFASSLPLNETNAVICTANDRATNMVLLEALSRFNFHGHICLTAMDESTASLLGEHPNVTVIKPLKMAAETIVDNLPDLRGGLNRG